MSEFCESYYIKRMVRIVCLILFFFVIYLFVFNPPFVFFPLTPIKLLYPFLFLLFLWSGIGHFLFSFKQENLLFGLVILYSFCTEFFRGNLFGENYNLFFLPNIFSYFEIIIFPYALSMFFYKKYGDFNLLSLLFYVALFAGIITLFLVLNPLVELFIRESVIRTSEQVERYLYRGYGVADQLFFTYSIVLGVALSYSIYFINRKKYIFLSIPIFVIGIIFNARIGLVPPIVLLIYFLLYRTGGKQVLLLFISLIICTIVIIPFIDFSDYEDTLEWAGSFFVEIYNALTGTESARTGSLEILNDMFLFPDNIFELICGTGRNVYDSLTIRARSDIGYIVQLNYGGILYCMLLLLFVLQMFIRLYSVEKWMGFLFIGVTLIANYKGPFITSSPGFRFFALMYFYTIISAYMNKQNLCDSYENFNCNNNV